MAPPYEALSYVWGSQGNPEQIFLNGHPYKITQNLQQALLQLRSPTEDRATWIDALTINQSDLAERSVQVQKMKIIYSMATRVLVWLGLGDDNTLMAFKAVNSVNMVEQSSGILPQPPGSVMRSYLSEAFVDLIYLNYWDRVWIVQEIMYAKEAIILLGATFRRVSIIRSVLEGLFEHRIR